MQNYSGCFVRWISFHQNSNFQNVLWKICQSQCDMMIRHFDICIIAMTSMTALISNFLDCSSEAMTFSGRLASFSFFFTLKEMPLQMKPLIYMATFEWFYINSVSLLHLSCQAIHQIAWSYRRSLGWVTHSNAEIWNVMGFFPSQMTHQ